MDEKKEKWKDIIRKSISYIFVAALASVLTLFFFCNSQKNQFGKLYELKSIIDRMFIGEVDQAYMDDVMASAMVV